MSDQFSGVSNSINSYGEGLGAFRRGVLPNINEWLSLIVLGVLVLIAVLCRLLIYLLTLPYGTGMSVPIRILIWIVISVVIVCFLVVLYRNIPANTLGVQVGPVGTRTCTVTDIVDDLPDGFYGMENLFMFCSFVEIPPEYGERFENKSDKDAGKCLEMFIEGYLVHEKNFRWCNPRWWCNQVQPDFDQDNSIFGEKVWELVKRIEPEADVPFMNPKLIEKSLECYGVTGRADCIIQRRDKASIIIDFKYTKQNDKDERYQNPSRSFALQLLLYQWMVGKEFEEKEGAELYIIRYYRGSNVMVLYQYQPPEDLQYSPDREKEYQPNVIDQVVEKFKESLQRRLGDKSEVLDQELPDTFAKMHLQSKQ